MPRKRTCDPSHTSNHDRCLLNILKVHLVYRLVISPFLIQLFLKSLSGKRKWYIYFFIVMSYLNISKLKLSIYHTWTLDVGNCSLHFHGDICLFPKSWILSRARLMKHTSKTFPLSYLPLQNKKHWSIHCKYGCLVKIFVKTQIHETDVLIV